MQNLSPLSPSYTCLDADRPCGAWLRRHRRGDGRVAAENRANETIVIPAQPGIQTRRRSIAVSVACVFAAIATPAAAQVKPATAGIETQDIRVIAHEIKAFHRSGAPFVNKHLAWRSGLVLTSPSALFGGWSGLAVDEAGKGFVAVSDSGIWMSGEIAYTGSSLIGIASARVGPLLNKKGGPLTRSRERDAEAIALVSGTPEKGSAYIAFEQADRIGLFTIDKGALGKPSSYLQMPKEAARMRVDGMEALTVLAGGPRKGSLIAFAENPPRGEAVHRGWIWTAGGEPKSFTLPGLDNFSITDAASLDDGSVLLLERRFRWFEGVRIRLRRLPAGSIKPGAAVRGDVLLAADTAQEIDNLEAIAISKGADGETVVTLLSDDNFNRFLQRTVLLQFTLKEESAGADETADAKP